MAHVFVTSMKGGERDVIVDFDVNRDKISISMIGNDDQAKYDMIFHG